MWIKISIAMLAFAVNSLLCRLALAEQQIDPMSFSLLRVGSGVVCLGLFYVVLQVQQPIQFQWKSATKPCCISARFFVGIFAYRQV